MNKFLALIVFASVVSGYANPFIKKERPSNASKTSALALFFEDSAPADSKLSAKETGSLNEKEISADSSDQKKCAVGEKNVPATIPVAAAEVAAPQSGTPAGVEGVSPEERKPALPREAKIFAKRTFYDRREGIAFFNGEVFVDDVEYKLHADNVYVFMDGTNELKRIVAIGNVAMTNGLKRAYASKASYYKKSGMVVLNAGENMLAEVYDDSKGVSQSVKGTKIRFWTASDQVEVLDANITAPTSGGVKGGFGSLKDALKK
jgi:lipopolysaccharide transport protein LptA